MKYLQLSFQQVGQLGPVNGVATMFCLIMGMSNLYRRGKPDEPKSMASEMAMPQRGARVQLSTMERNKVET